MGIDQIITKVFDNLPDIIRLEPYFKNLKDIALKEACGEFVSFVVHEDVFNTLDDEVKKNIKVASNPEMILRYALDISGGLVFLTIKYVENLLFIELKKDIDNKITSVIYTKFPTISRIETTEILKGNGFYEDYLCNIYYYDSDFKLISGATEEEKDIVFSQEFKIPVEFARILRMNFSKYSEQISRYISSKQMEGYDALLSDEELCTFLSPFYLDEFADFINGEYSREKSEAYKLIVGEDADSIYNNEFVGIEENLKAQIGTDGEIVISANIYRNLIFVLLGVIADGISTTGYIIKKLDGIYTFYNVNITNNQVVLLPRIISGDEARKIYFMNESNQEVEGLAEFFGITRGR